MYASMLRLTARRTTNTLLRPVIEYWTLNRIQCCTRFVRVLHNDQRDNNKPLSHPSTNNTRSDKVVTSRQQTNTSAKTKQKSNSRDIQRTSGLDERKQKQDRSTKQSTMNINDTTDDSDAYAPRFITVDPATGKKLRWPKKEKLLYSIDTPTLLYMITAKLRGGTRSTMHLIVRPWPNGRPPIDRKTRLPVKGRRVAYVTSKKKIGKLAVTRNRARRRLAAAARVILPREAKPGYDYLLIAKPETLTADFKQIQRDLRELLHAQGLHRDDTAKNTQTNRAKQKNSSKSASKKSSQTHRTHSPSSKS